MTCSTARLIANQNNASKSTGPKTAEGKERSRANAYKHGLTGEGVVLPEVDAAEVELRTVALRSEFRPSGSSGEMLVRRVAVLSVRMERGFVQETAALSENVRQAQADFEAPEGLDEATIARLRAEAGRRALFDPSKEATLARKYEAAAERGFFRALKELHQLERDKQGLDKVARPTTAVEGLGSLLPDERVLREMKKFNDEQARSTPPTPPKAVAAAVTKPREMSNRSSFDVPFTIGRAG